MSDFGSMRGNSKYIKKKFSRFQPIHRNPLQPLQSLHTAKLINGPVNGHGGVEMNSCGRVQTLGEQFPEAPSSVVGSETRVQPEDLSRVQKEVTEVAKGL